MMRFRRVIRLGGYALIAAALVQVPATVFDPDLVRGINAINSRAWIPTHVAFVIAYTLILPGLVALYVRQADRMGWLGEIGLVLAMFGSALTVSVSMLVGAALPLIGAQTPTLTRSLAFFESGRPLHFMRPAVAFTALTYFPGFILTGIASMRARVLSRMPALLLVLGAVGTLGALAGPGALGRSIVIAGSLLLGAALAWFGYELVADNIEHSTTTNVLER